MIKYTRVKDRHIDLPKHLAINLDCFQDCSLEVDGEQIDPTIVEIPKNIEIKDTHENYI